MKQLKAGVYKHFKGNYYLVLGVGKHTETDEAVVIYVPLYLREGPRISVRPLENFFDKVMIDGKKEKRFTFVGTEIPEHVIG